MVEVKELLYIDAENFFKYIAESVAYDINEATGKNIRPKQIKKGFSYKKIMRNKVKRKGEVKVTITDYDIPHLYRAEFTSATGMNVISYAVEELEDGRIGVTYIEDYKGTSKSKDLNFKLMSLFYKRKAEKRATKLLRAIEQYAQQEKGKKEMQEKAAEEI